MPTPEITELLNKVVNDTVTRVMEDIHALPEYLHLKALDAISNDLCGELFNPQEEMGLVDEEHPYFEM